MRLRMLLAVSFSSLAMLGCADPEPQPGARGEGWLLAAENDQVRFQQLQGYLGGFSSAMWETGYRFSQVHDAVVQENYPLAQYHWDKIRAAIEKGYQKRPARRANAEALFLDGPWQGLDQALKQGETAAVQRAFSQARQACMACHVAEDVPFMNDTPVLRDSALAD